MMTSCSQWIIHAQRDPPVSSVLLPRKVASSTPERAGGLP